MVATRIRSLDGLRAIAIVLVMLHHSPAMKAHFGAPRYGWIGVDLFFVLSGYLITGILVEARGGPNYYRNFYARRALRIWPLYFAVLIAITVVMPRVVHSEHLSVGLAPWYYFLLLQNLFFTRPLLPFLSPTWSLAVEEQFYLIWPFVISLISRTNLVRLCVFGLLASPMLRLGVLMAGGSGDINYGFTFTHMDGLLAGALVALTPAERIALPRVRAAAIGALLLAVVVFFAEDHRLSNIRDSVIVVSALAVGFGSLLVITLHSESKGGRLARVLSWRPFTYVGQVSYCLYLTHELVQVIAEKSGVGVAVAALPTGVVRLSSGLLLESAACLVVASVSWYGFESPILRLKRFFESKSKVAAVTAG